MCSIGGMLAWNFGVGTIHICKKAFGPDAGRPLGTVIVAESGMNKSWLPRTEEYSFAAWLSALLTAEDEE
jgi:hypothetical protein